MSAPAGLCRPATLACQGRCGTANPASAHWQCASALQSRTANRQEAAGPWQRKWPGQPPLRRPRPARRRPGHLRHAAHREHRLEGARSAGRGHERAEREPSRPRPPAERETDGGELRCASNRGGCGEEGSAGGGWRLATRRAALFVPVCEVSACTPRLYRRALARFASARTDRLCRGCTGVRCRGCTGAWWWVAQVCGAEVARVRGGGLHGCAAVVIMALRAAGRLSAQ